MRVLILPGWQQKPEDWASVVRALEQQNFPATVVEYEMPKKDDLEDIIEAVSYHITEKCVIVAHSIGGRAAVQLCSQPPHHVVGLFLMSTPSLSYTGIWHRLYKIYRFFSAPIRILIPGIIKRYSAMVWTKLITRSPERRHYRLLISSDQDSLLPIQKLPVKLLWGSKDSVVKPEIGEAMAEMIPRSDFVSVAGMNDKLFMTEPDLVADAIIDFAKANS